jgi:hypothetical protein
MDTLTDRARDVAERLKAGEAPGAIAKALGMGVNGVYQHRRRLIEKGFKFPKSGRGKRTKATAASAAAQSPKVVTNGHLVHLLGDTKTDLGKRIETIGEAEGANRDERERIEVEMKERSDRLEALKGESDSLATTKGALEQAREAIPA